MMPLDKNESYWLLDDELVAAQRAPARHELSTYPDYDELRDAIASYAGVVPEQVLVTPGSVAAIEYLARAYAAAAEAVLPVPTFYYYENLLDSVKAHVVPIAYEEIGGRFVFPLERTLEALRRGTARVLFLCHPNNPLGSSLTKADIEALVAAAKDSPTMIVSDEAYFEFSSGLSFLPYLSELPNLVIIRSLSKAFALSGARLGYVIASPKIVQETGAFMLPWAVAYPSIAPALALLARSSQVKARRDVVMAAREQFARALGGIPGITAYPSETNFVLTRVPDAQRASEALLARGMRVALGSHMSRFPEAAPLLENTLRIAIPAPESQAAFLEELSRSLH